MAKKSSRFSKSSAADQPEWADKITDVANAVAEMFVDDIPKGKNLDFSENSLETMDKLIKKLWGDEGPSEKNLETMIWAVGCYVAEVLQRHYNGIWCEGSDGYSFDCEKSGAGVSPWNWVAKRFDSGMDEALSSKYKLAKSLLAADRKAA